MIIASTEPGTTVFFITESGAVAAGVLADGVQNCTDLVPVESEGACLAKTRAALYLTPLAACTEAVKLATRRIQHWQLRLQENQDRINSINKTAQKAAQS